MNEVTAWETREFAITDIKVAQTNTYINAESVYDEGYAGSPSYALGLDNNLKDVQYATVDNGKLYLSRSYGSGAGNSINFGFGDSSYLTIADIDLSVPGDTPVTISTTGTGSLDKTIMAHNISKYKDYPMMPMSEGLCVIEGNIFITFEGNIVFFVIILIVYRKGIGIGTVLYTFLLGTFLLLDKFVFKIFMV